MSRKRKPTRDRGRLPAQELERKILELFNRRPKIRLSAGQITESLHAVNNRDSVDACLERLSASNKILQVRGGKFVLNAETPTVEKGWHIMTGIVDMTRSGAAYVIAATLGKDIFVPSSRVHNAMHGDSVQVKWRISMRGNPEGEIMSVLERKSDTFTGTLFMARRYAYVVPDNQRINMDFHVDLNDLNNAQEGDRVIIRITEWHDGRRIKYPRAKVVTVMGTGSDSDMEMKSILLKNGFDWNFPEEVEKENEAIAEVITEEEIATRRDFRNVTTFTIDPLTAKDFDDALSVKYLDKGEVEIGVHIADVTHYVRPGTALDREALRRSTSVYLVDRVAPMLPEKLSNGVCSLRPNEDKLTFSAVFIFDEHGKVKSEWFGKTIIHSNRRFTYEEAQEVIETGKGDYQKELEMLNRYAKAMRAERMKTGAIDFEAPEMYFKLDETGKPIDVQTKERKDAHMLIEEYMLLANKHVAGLIYKLPEQGKPGMPYIYRVHDTPNIEKVADFSKFAKAFGYALKLDTPDQIAHSMNRMILTAQGKPELELLSSMAIRTMAKATYSSDNIGHYGLAFAHYSHFTSPIRRYADVLAHRLLFTHLTNKGSKIEKGRLEEICRHISAQERKATECERESIKYKSVEFMMDQKGKTFEGVISGIADHGIFVELKQNRCEGRITFDQFPESFQVDTYHIKGRKTGKIYRMGDTVKVRIVDTNLAKRQIDMVIEL